jgi:hypothetical protein
MTIQDLKTISTSFFFHWYNSEGSNTYQGFDSWVTECEDKILKSLEDLGEDQGRYVKYIAKRTDLNIEFVRLLLGKLRDEGKIKRMMFFSDSTGKAAGSGYTLIN